MESKEQLSWSRKYNDGIYKLIKPAPSSNYSSETPYHFTQLKKIIKPKNDMIVYDITSNVGGFSLQIAPFVKKVYSYEIDVNTYKIFKNNIKLLKYKNVTANNFSIKTNDELESGNVILYCDPPWGGVDYKKHKNLSLYMNNVNVAKFLYKIKKNNPHIKIYLKAPKNYNEEDLKIFKKYDKYIIMDYIDIYKKYKSSYFLYKI